ncbi:hypothetical protein KIPB_001415, partial [Kipferlia bialata]|eukprot:g1415.t1
MAVGKSTFAFLSAQTADEQIAELHTQQGPRLLVSDLERASLSAFPAPMQKGIAQHK